MRLPGPSIFTDRRAYLYTAAVVLVALLPRLYVAIAWSKEPVWDGHYYQREESAARVAARMFVRWKGWVSSGMAGRLTTR